MLLENYTGDSKVLKAIAHILNRKAPLPLDGDGDAEWGTNGQVLTTDGLGTTSWATPSGGDSVEWTQIQQSGTKIAEIDINGTTQDVYAPNGGSTYTEGDGIDISAQDVISVDTTFTEASTRANITSGDTLATLFGKIKKFFSDLKTVAFTGNYSDLSGTPTIPTVNNGTLTIQKNGTNVQTFTANQSSNATANITVPTKESDLTADRGYITSSGSCAYATSAGSATDSTKVAKAGDTMSGLLQFSNTNGVQLNFRTGHAGYDGTVSYQTAGNEALVFATKADITSFMFVNGEDSITNASNTRWQSLTPGLQIKSNKVAIGKLIANGSNLTYPLEVNGDVLATNFRGNLIGNATSATSAGSATSATSATTATKATQDADGNDIRQKYVNIYNTSDVGGSGTVTVNDLAKQGSSVAMIAAATDHPQGSSKWVHVISLAWKKGVNTSWVSQIALGVEDSNGMWYRTTKGTIIGAGWKRLIDSSNIGSQSVNYANYAGLLSYSHTNEINFKGGKQQSTWFNYRNADTDQQSAYGSKVYYRFGDYSATTANSVLVAKYFEGYLVDSNAKGAFATLNPSVICTLYIQSDTNLVYTVNGSVRWNTGTSSRRYKRNVKTLTDERAKKILKIRPVTFDYIDSVVSTTRKYDKAGVVAEEVAQVLDDVVVYENIGQDKSERVPRTVNYEEFTPYLIRMCQIQQRQIDDLTSKVDALQQMILSLTK